MIQRAKQTRSDNVAMFVLATGMVAVVLVAVVWWVDHTLWTGPINWPAVAAMTAMYLIGEVHSVAWLSRRDGGVVTPGWAFSYALLLLGVPTVAVLATAVACILPDVVRRKGLLRTSFNASQTVIALAAATLLLTVVGGSSPLGIDAELRFAWMVGIVIAAGLIFVINSLLTAIVIALNQGVSVGVMLRQATKLSVSADGALLALSPLFVIAADFNLLTTPLLGLIAFLVFHSARQALEREHRASHDHLTSLLNARAFIGHLDGHLTAYAPTGAAGCVLLLDLDGFKQINDRLGHHIGDAVLNQVGQRLVFDRDAGAVASRLGGDEFAVLIPDASDREAAMRLGHQVAAALSEPLMIDGFPVTIGASIGIVLLDSTSGTADEVLRAADVAMYEAKRSRSVVSLANVDRVAPQTGGRLALLAGLRGALDSDSQLQMAYQPLVDLHGGRVVGFEALLRWQHPKFGAVTPADFVALAENTDLITEITERVLELVAFDSHQFLAIDPDLQLAVNVSTRNLRSRHFPDVVNAILSTNRLAAKNISVEVTESAFDAQPEITSDVINRLRSSGLNIAIDDFGAGYSSFSRLLDLPIDQIKIDRSLIGQMASDQRGFLIVKAVIELSHAMGVTCIAEGVEDLGILHQLRMMGCDYAQGFVIARPMAAPIAAAWLAERPLGIPIHMEHAR